MSKFSDRKAFFESIYDGDAPWDVGAAQRALVELLEEFPPKPPILDVGCGTGDLVIELARRGWRTVGVDLIPKAIKEGKRRIREAGTAVADLAELRVGDALRPAELGERFGAVVDSGFYHVFEAEQRDAFERQLAQALAPGGRYYLLGFAIDFPIPNTPIMVTRDELNERFSADRGWRALTVRDARFDSRMGPVDAIAACLERTVASRA